MFHVKHRTGRTVAKVLGAAFMILIGSLWLFSCYMGIRFQADRLGLGRQARVRELMGRAEGERDWWERWLCYREVLEAVPDHYRAQSGRERAYYHFVGEARRAKIRGDLPEAVRITVKAIRIKPEKSSLWGELEIILKDLRRKNPGLGLQFSLK